MRKLLVLMALAVVAGSVLMAGPADEARANGVPQLVKLTYLAGVSNWGPQNAEGVLEFSFAEAYARVDVKNLPPVAGTIYEGWLVTPGGDTLLVGQIPITSDGIGSLDTKLTGLNRYDYSLFVITGRASDSNAGIMPANKSIAGRFAVVTDSTSGQAGDTRPSSLPNTGEKPDPGMWARWLPTIVATVAASVVGGLWYRWNHRRKDQ